MAEQMYLEFPIKLQHVKAFKELCNSAIGFALTKKQPGFVSAEWMISTSEDAVNVYTCGRSGRVQPTLLNICKLQSGQREVSLICHLASGVRVKQKFIGVLPEQSKKHVN